MEVCFIYYECKKVTMKKIICVALILTSISVFNKVDAQYLPPAYEVLLNEIIENFAEIRGTTSLNDGKTSLRMLSEEKLILRLDHKKSVKTMTFVKENDEEGNKYWMSANKLTTDMINKYEKDVTKVMKKMLELSRELAKQ